MPTYKSRTHKLTFFGDMFGGTEEWTTSLFIGNDTGGDQGASPTVAEAQAAATAFNTLWSGAANGFNGAWRFQGVKASLVDTTGHIDVSETVFYTLPTPTTGNGGATSFPPQVSLVATLTTAIARGPGSKGRMFLPGVGWGIDSGAKIPGTNVNTLATALKTFLDAINASADIPGSIVVNSAEKTGVPFRAALMTKVTGVKVGDVYDTQRRRRNQLKELYTAKALA